MQIPGGKATVQEASLQLVVLAWISFGLIVVILSCRTVGEDVPLTAADCFFYRCPALSF